MRLSLIVHSPSILCFPHVRFDLRDELKTLKLPKLGEYKDKLNRKVEIARQKAAQIEAELEEMIDSNTMKMASIST